MLPSESAAESAAEPTAPGSEAPPARRELGRIALAVAGAAAACMPGFPAAAALATGAAIALTFGNPLEEQTRALSRRLLPLSVIGLGGAMDLAAVARAGAHGIGYTVATISACFALGLAIARLARVDRTVATLVTVGTAICGGSAIAAAAPAIGADSRETSVALGTVFLLNAVALLAFPPIGHALGLGDAAFGLWAALAIHDTSSVVGAALHFGPRAVEVATTVKLARALWIVPVTVLLGLAARRRGVGKASTAARPPWFIAGFLAVAAAATFLPALRPAGHVLAAVASRALVLTLYLIGLGLSRAGLRAVGWRPLALGVALWLAMGTGTLAAIHAGWLSA